LEQPIDGAWENGPEAGCLIMLSRAPMVAMILEGKHAVENVVNMAGPQCRFPRLRDNPRDYSTDSAAYANAEKRGVMNVVHISASLEEANVEKALWFTPEEIQNYKRMEEYI